ncbi:YqhG family protein [Paenibacillus mucilaginosus]|uniref:YqhG family protein n=1 Tax=Paenibacillus mucilaginosus TaxID=61624 RepID=UPI00240D9F36|nr:YqhG family protein [Paenibacillus mucilaginosus]
MMNAEQIRSFVMRYLEAEQCEIQEKHPAYVTVKLSPSADRDLNHRPYYWSFVERTGVTPETMTCTFVFDPETYRELNPPPQGGPVAPGPMAALPAWPARAQGRWLHRLPLRLRQRGRQVRLTPGPGQAPAGPAPAGGPQPPGSPPPQGDSILGRYFGFVPTSFVARVPRDEMTYGSRRLEQIFGAVRGKGRFVRLFEHYVPDQPKMTSTVPYESWLAVNYKVELACDMKRSEIHSIGIQLQTGQLREGFHEWISGRRMTPRLPAHVYVTPDKITLPRAVLFLEQYLEEKLAAYDHGWAREAQLRLREELERIRGYYDSLLQAAEPDKRAEIEAQYTNRINEIEWQYHPRVHVSAINCGLFHVPAANRASF